ncbi:MAG: pyridoxamine 5'-phosphate oxidase family protein [Phycisphaerales bacterium]
MTQPNPTDVRQTCLDLIAATSVCYLATLDADGFPHTTALGNLRCAKEFPSLVEFQAEYDNDFTLFMSTDMHSEKVARIRTNPKAAAYLCDPDQVVGFMIGGNVEIVEDRQLKNRLWQKEWVKFFPSGPQGPEYGIIKLVPRIAKGWCRTESFVLTLSPKGDNRV